jgi:hypothetical protein
MLLLKLLVVPGLVAVVTLAVRRWGPAVGGWLAGLPIVAGPVLVFYALEQGDAFAAQAAHATLAGLIATVVFAVTYGLCSRRLPWYACMLIGWCAFAAAVVSLYLLEPGIVLSLVLLTAATFVGRRLLSRVRSAEPGRRTNGYVGRVPAQPDPPDTSPGDLLTVRLVATAALVLVLTGLAARLGPAWSGLLNAFPVLTTIVAVFSHAQRGVPAAAAFLHGYLQAIPGFGLFCVVMTIALGSFGLWPALAAALAVQLAWHAALLSGTARFAAVSRC